MTCQGAIDVLADFLEQTLSSEAGAELEAHLRGCEPCRAYLRTYDKTRRLAGGAGRIEMPPELKARLRQFLLDQLSKRPAN
ncbi:MAG TPA: zf-HC2 domain-containing protein [Methylomirabilota bacterium]|jgi:predicted anti-sigma-YlaC factor YlaD|nr:zf-HC2 domain-containing protein [Methylomirabilota bacterium]